jgi:2,3-bisphosphoglycerate-independent phosphoglycerate mutase
MAQSVAAYVPVGEGAQHLNNIMCRSAERLRDHRFNGKGQAEGTRASTSVWFGVQGKKPSLPTLRAGFGVDGSGISTGDLVSGLGRLGGLRVITVSGATGFLDTDYRPKARYGLASLKSTNFFLVYMEAPEEAAHIKGPDLKVQAIERIDELITHHMLRESPTFGDFSLPLMPDHAIRSGLKTHSNESVPFAMVLSRQLSNTNGSRSREIKRRYPEHDAAQTPCTSWRRLSVDQVTVRRGPAGRVISRGYRYGAQSGTGSRACY